MRIRINENAVAYQTSPSALYRRFRKIFETVLATTNPALEYRDWAKWYIPMPALEQALYDTLFDNSADHLHFLVGHTGIGKSTVLQKLIGTDTGTHMPQRSSYVHYLSFNPRFIRDDAGLMKVLCAGYRAASYRLRDICQKTFTDNELTDFMVANCEEVLLRPDLPFNATTLQFFQTLLETDRRAYELVCLKKLALETDIEHLCIVVDDLESLTVPLQLAAIREVVHAHRCLIRNKGRKHKVSTLIVLRPDTYAFAKQQVDLSPFGFQAVDFGKPVDLYDLMKVRFDDALRSAEADRTALKSDWRTSIDVCCGVMKELGAYSTDCIVALANSNVREALNLFTGVLRNGHWFERNRNPYAAIHVEECNYYVNAAGVLRSLAMPKTQMYFDRDDSPVVNLCHNTPEEGSDLIVSYVVRYLLRQSDKINWASLWVPYDLNVLESQLLELLPNSFNSLVFRSAVDWMISRGLLWTVDDRKCAITPRAVEIWNLLRANGILAQCYREDIYRGKASPLWDMPTASLSADKVFADTIELALEIVAVEQKHIAVAASRSALAQMRECFGLNLLSLQFLRGLSISLKQFFKDPAEFQSMGQALEPLRLAVTITLEKLRDGAPSAGAEDPSIF
jgi:hypothetical protein